MKKGISKIQDFQKKLDKSQLIAKLAKKNLKGGDKCPPPFELDA